MDNQFTNAIRVGASHNWSVKLPGGSVFEFKNLYNQLSNTQYIQRSGFDNGSNWDIKTLSLTCIEFYVKRFIAFAIDNPDLIFYLTPIGTGLAGYTHDEIAPLFKGVPDKVS